MANAKAQEQAAESDLALTRVSSAAAVDQAKSALALALHQVAVARQQADASEADATRAGSDFKRYEDLVKTSDASRQRYEQAVAEARGSEARLRGARGSVSASESQVAEAQARLDDANAAPQRISMKEAQLATAKALVAQAEAALHQAQLNLSYTKVGASVSGRIAKKAVEPGNVIQRGQILSDLVADPLWVIANFKETQLARMKIGQPVSIRIELPARPAVERACRQLSAGQRIALRLAAAGKRNRQLREGGPARSGQDRVRRGRCHDHASVRSGHVGGSHRRCRRARKMSEDGAGPAGTPSPLALTASHSAAAAVTGRVGEGHAPMTPWLVAPVVALAAFMEVLDISIANVSLQHISGDLAASQDESTWVLTSYLVTNAIVLPISGWLASVIGRKRFFITCIIGFSIASLLCGLAPNLETLILFRALQGLTGGGLQPLSQAILADSFPPKQRGMAFALFGIAVVFAPAIGPTLGGWITDTSSWRWVFLLNVPIGAVLAILLTTMIEDTPELIRLRLEKIRQGLRIDYLGFGLIAIGLGFLQVVLDKGQEDNWLEFALHRLDVDRIGRGLDRVCDLGTRPGRPDRGSASARRPQLHGREPADVRPRLHPARQHRVATRRWFSSCSATPPPTPDSSSRRVDSRSWR